MTIAGVSVLNAALVVAGVIFSAAAILALFRLVKGPSLLDRVVAADVLLVIFSGALMAKMAASGSLDTLPLVLALTVVGFCGALTVARYVADRGLQ